MNNGGFEVAPANFPSYLGKNEEKRDSITPFFLNDSLHSSHFFSLFFSSISRHRRSKQVHTHHPRKCVSIEDGRGRLEGGECHGDGGWGWDGVRWDGRMGWDGMGWDGVGWMGWDEMGWMGWDGMGWDGG